MHGWKLSRCVNVNQLLLEHAISHLCPRIELSNIISQSTLKEKLVFSRLIKVASLMFCVPLPSCNFMVSIKDVFCSERRKMTDQWNRQIKHDLS